MFRRCLALSICALAAQGCSIHREGLAAAGSTPAQISDVTPSQRDLLAMPPPANPIPIAVYSYTDQTGQLRPSESFQSLSRAVSQGGTSILVGALQDAGGGRWFTVLERERLDNVLRERQIIREMRREYLRETQTPASVLPSMLFAGVLLEGGIIGYDSNVETGGLGARFLGIGGSTEYRRSTVSVYLRAVSVRTGEVLLNVTSTKTIAAVQLRSNLFGYVTFDELLEAEAGVTANEPTTVALQQAIETAVYALILEGVGRSLWSFGDTQAGQAWLDRYANERRRALTAASRMIGGGRQLPRPRAPAPAPAPAQLNQVPGAVAPGSERPEGAGTPPRG